MLALHTRSKPCELQGPVVRDARGVTLKAGPRLRVREFAPERLEQRARLNPLIADRHIQALRTGVVADHAFVALAVVLEHEGLRSRSKGPLHRHGHRLRTIADGVRTLPVARRDAIG